jgi:hypothetical protein
MKEKNLESKIGQMAEGIAVKKGEFYLKRQHKYDMDFNHLSFDDNAYILKTKKFIIEVHLYLFDDWSGERNTKIYFLKNKLIFSKKILIYDEKSFLDRRWKANKTEIILFDKKTPWLNEFYSLFQY